MSEPSHDAEVAPRENARDNARETQNGRRRIGGLPRVDERRLGSSLASILIHALVLLFLFMPAAQQVMKFKEELGAGGAGPVGGGGGGHRGTGGVQSERVQFMAAAPTPKPTVVSPPRVIPPIEKKPDPVVPTPPVPTPPEPTKSDTAAKTANTEVASAVAGSGGGSGNDGSRGNGPGTGGGVGSGNGTGRGTHDGAGTGGGPGTVYPASVTTLVILPLPVPAKIKPYVLQACFEVDSTGKQKLLPGWTKSKDDSYNKKVEETLRGYRFRPASRLDGTTVRDTACVQARGG